MAPDRNPLSYGKLCRHVAHVVEQLNNVGLGRNERIAVVLPNGPEMAMTFLSVIAGATCAPLNPAYQEKEFDFYLSDINAKAVIVQSGMDSPVRWVARSRNITLIELTPRREAEAGLFDLEFPGTVSPTRVNTGLAGPDDTALVLHTSGTTSRPKIVPLTQANIFASAEHVSASLDLTDSDRCLNVMPLFHIHGLIAALLSSLHTGGSVICTSGFSEAHFFEWTKKLGPTWYTAVPTIHQRVLEVAEKQESAARAARFRFIRSSSSALPPVVMERLEGTFNVPVIEAYGMTEAAHQMASNPLPPRMRKPGSVGLPAGPEVAIMDDKDTILPHGEPGEIVIRGVNVMKGYENNPEANEKAFSSGWFRTGDLGYMDDDRYLYISGRLKEIINRGGQKVSPREIDEVLLQHPAVLQAVAFGVPHSRLGEAVAAAVVIKGDEQVTERELRQHVADCLAPYKVPQHIVFLDSIPKGPTGKVQRIGLADKLADHLKPAYSAPETGTEIAVAMIWQEVLGLKRAGKYDNFFMIGGDSLLSLQVTAHLSEEFDYDLPVFMIFQHPVLTDLASAIDQARSGFEDGAEAPRFYTLVPIQPDGPQPPFFWFHSQLVSFLPGYLGQNQPVYAFIAQGVDGKRARYRTTKDISAHYLRELRAVQPAGPYFLGGFCWGAQIAFAIANQLLHDGEDVALLFLVEPLLSNADAKQTFASKLRLRVKRHQRELARLSFTGKVIHVITEILKSARIYRLLSEAYLMAGRPVPLSLRIPYALAVIHRATRDFIQEPCARRVIVVQAEKGMHPAHSDWGNLSTEEVTVHVVPGAAHIDMLQEPATGMWAGWLNRYVQRAHEHH